MRVGYSKTHRYGLPLALSLLALGSSAAWSEEISPLPPKGGSETGIRCPGTAAIASGNPLPTLFSATASKGIRALWCERYDEFARTIRVGPYRELYPGGTVRTEASFRAGRLHGPLLIRHEDGRPWLRSAYVGGVEVGPLEIFHPSGALWLEGEIESGALHGPLRTYFPDGSPESETRFEHGHEQGLARSFYPASVGGRVRSEVRVDADRVVGEPRLLDVAGHAASGIPVEPAPAALAPAVPATPTSRTSPSPQAGGSRQDRHAGD